MRNFRTAAVASATALTVFVGGTAIASAQSSEKPETTATAEQNGQDNNDTKKPEEKKSDKDKQVIFAGKQEGDKSFGDVVKDGTAGLFNGKGSSKYFNQEVNGMTDAERPFYPTDAFGKKTNPEAVPQWARYWIDGTIVAGIGALVGLVIAGINFASYNGFIQLPKF
ncbi:hypothetical protein [Corynebacterium coyleae]|uniref:hypothetical protein n=1 Tax=Corynebacterium coyleae TaxID=53374 RepID=UPI00254A0D8E|nr:hypothetical protein [Corynebacterium coyleae]MDK8662852.1 hypothetical protein [Corynebacterium coyleae]MDK8706102.1 hypothetical protein [Corynebacterium coyleae]MDK8732811.1 hypothetical protein [Corynebacterium coyleae]MDK8892143.1 hypothetical protein [Corynebacterium coyleae]